MSQQCTDVKQSPRDVRPSREKEKRQTKKKERKEGRGEDEKEEQATATRSTFASRRSRVELGGRHAQLVLSTNSCFRKIWRLIPSRAVLAIPVDRDPDTDTWRRHKGRFPRSRLSEPTPLRTAAAARKVTARIDGREMQINHCRYSGHQDTGSESAKAWTFIFAGSLLELHLIPGLLTVRRPENRLLFIVRGRALIDWQAVHADVALDIAFFPQMSQDVIDFLSIVHRPQPPAKFRLQQHIRHRQ